MDTLIIRTGALIGHILLNIVAISYFLIYDITGSWLAVILFMCAFFLLLAFLIVHFVSYIKFLKTKIK